MTALLKFLPGSLLQQALAVLAAVVLGIAGYYVYSLDSELETTKEQLEYEVQKSTIVTSELDKTIRLLDEQGALFSKYTDDRAAELELLQSKHKESIERATSLAAHLQRIEDEQDDSNLSSSLRNTVDWMLLQSR